MHFLSVHTVNLASSETVSNIWQLGVTKCFFQEFTAPVAFNQQSLMLPSLFIDFQSVLQGLSIFLSPVLVILWSCPRVCKNTGRGTDLGRRWCPPQLPGKAGAASGPGVRKGQGGSPCAVTSLLWRHTGGGVTSREGCPEARGGARAVLPAQRH